MLARPAARCRRGAYRTTIVTNASAGSSDVVERVTEAGATDGRPTRPLGLAWPADVFSLSHIALPFPLDDPLYGMQPDRDESFGVALGAIAPRGERGALVVSVESLAAHVVEPVLRVPARTGRRSHRRRCGARGAEAVAVRASPLALV